MNLIYLGVGASKPHFEVLRLASMVAVQGLKKKKKRMLKLDAAEVDEVSLTSNFTCRW